MQNDRIGFNRAAFLAGTLAAASVALPNAARSAAPAAPGVAPDDALAHMMAGNAKFVANEFPHRTASRRSANCSRKRRLRSRRC